MNGRIISSYLRDRGIRHALIGAVAVAVRGHARSTLDIDFLAADAAVLRSEFWDELRATQATIDVRRGDLDDPLRGVVRITLADRTMIDLVVAKYRWQADVIDRAEPIEIDGATIPVPCAGDLILLKLFAGGHQDIADIRSLLDSPERDTIVAEVGEHLSELPEDCQRLWSEIETG